jgi:hypothetical protein
MTTAFRKCWEIPHLKGDHVVDGHGMPNFVGGRVVDSRPFIQLSNAIGGTLEVDLAAEMKRIG